LVARLEPRAGERWLDVATGTGEVAIRAAAAGADVTGVDIAPAMVERARAKAPGIEFELGDVQALEQEDASFDVVSSSFGFIFAADHAATAREITRVCRDRLGFTAWEPNPELRDLYDRFDLDLPEGRHPFQWGRTEHIKELLGDAFDLELEHGTWVLEGSDGEENWSVWSNSSPPFMAMVESLEPDRRAAFREAYIEYCERYRDGDRVRVPRKYVLVLGRKR
jgi:SAM-dependent methyltransferase